MIQQAPDLELTPPPPAPPEGPGGDHLPERDWAVIGLLVVIVVVGTHTTVRAALQLWREIRG